jgi:hypothetical protein
MTMMLLLKPALPALAQAVDGGSALRDPAQKERELAQPTVGPVGSSDASGR